MVKILLMLSEEKEAMKVKQETEEVLNLIEEKELVADKDKQKEKDEKETVEEKEENNANVLDVSSLSCPMPILLLKRRLDKMSKDDVLELISAVGVMKRDIITFCEMKGYIIENITEQYGKVHFKIRKFF